MAFSKLTMASLILSLVVLQLTHAAAADNYPSTPTIDCKGACKARCQLSSRPNLCHRACGTCCKRCSCVPPGTAGNYDKCVCYASLTTHGGRRKCP